MVKLWTGLDTTDAKWSRSANWSPSGAPVAGDDLQFGGTTRLITDNDIAADTSFASITFNSGAGAFTLAGNRITLAGNISQNSTNSHTISLNIITTAQRNVDFANTGGITISGIISGSSGGIETTGTGVLTLSGTNTFTGYVWAIGGTISVNAIADAGTACPLGAGADDLNGSIYLGDGAGTGTLLYTGSGHTTNRRISLYGATGGGVVDQSGTGLLKFTTATIGETDGNKTLTLKGSTAGTGEFSAAIPNPATGAVSITKSGTGLWTFSAANTYTGTTTISAGTIKFSGGANRIKAGNNIVVTGTLDMNGQNQQVGQLTGAGSVITNGADMEISYGSPAGFTWGGVISGNGSVTKNGTGSVNYTGDNTYTGNTTITAGRIKISALTKIASTSAIITSDFGQLWINATGTFPNAIQLNGPGYSEGGAIPCRTGGVRVNNSLTLSGTITVTGTSGRIGLVVTSTTQTATISGKITGAVGIDFFGCNNGNSSISNFIVSNTGNDYQGNTTLYCSDYAGARYTCKATLVLGASGVIPDVSTVSLTGADADHLTILDLASYSETIDGLTNTAATGAIVDNVSAGGTPTLTIGNNNATATFSGVIQNTTGTLALTKVGNGIQTLSGANTYTGATTITSGTLLVNGSISGTGAVTVSNTATLGGIGTIAGAITQNSGSFINPGNGDSNIGTLGTAAVTMNASSTYKVDLNGTTPTYDQINSSGIVSCAGTLTINSITNAVTGKTYTIINAVTRSNTFAGMTDGSIFVQQNRAFLIVYSGTQVQLTDVSLRDRFSFTDTDSASETFWQTSS